MWSEAHFNEEADRLQAVMDECSKADCINAVHVLRSRINYENENSIDGDLSVLHWMIVREELLGIATCLRLGSNTQAKHFGSGSHLRNALATGNTHVIHLLLAAGASVAEDDFPAKSIFDMVSCLDIKTQTLIMQFAPEYAQSVYFSRNQQKR